MNATTFKVSTKNNISILGGGNIGLAVAKGLVNSGQYKPEQIIITRKQTSLLKHYEKDGFQTFPENSQAVENSTIVIIAVRPRQVESLLPEIKSKLIQGKHIVISLVTGVTIKQISEKIGKNIWITRAMPNIAVAIGQSMTCFCADDVPDNVIKTTELLFNAVGKTVNIAEEYITPATALCACGVAFFLRSIRAASQGGIEIGFHWDEALLMAAQTAKGAASLLLESNKHPESEIDKVTTPRGVTISGLNEMEHQGFSSAMIKGIVTSARKAEKLLDNNGD
ncbi:pyrroline-5-carboxylate reductase [candidate division KSB1 bacterium]|nr:pyrroline-5-carboxylate reductase [candidate division KSB1 bacterium]